MKRGLELIIRGLIGLKSTNPNQNDSNQRQNGDNRQFNEISNRAYFDKP